MQPRRPALVVHGTLLGAVLAVLVTSSGLAMTLDRDSDPVVMQGADLADLTGLAPDLIVAFRYSAGWSQIPVQIDQRFVNDFGIVYNLGPIGITTLAYADGGTFMGPDPDATFDADDELVFMARDAGDPAPAGEPDPAGVVAGSRVDLLITDPLTLNEARAYLFETDGSLTPSAGEDYVSYTFNLLAGDYLTHYNTASGPNPEDSPVASAFYSEHFSDRWIRDATRVLAGTSSGVDLLDRHKTLFAPGVCARSEDTFSDGEGAFFANIDGPVRGIRSYMGANSGPLTQRDHFFYERRHDVVTSLRVHAIASVLSFYDYSPEATGMTYYNDLNQAGVTIDGTPEAVPPGPIVWEMATGAQGTLIHASSFVTDIPGFTYTSYYEDDDTPPLTTQCTGDPWAYGSSGPFINRPIPNTDPALGEHNILVTSRIVYAEGPDQAVSLAEARYQQATHPLIAGVVASTAAALGNAPGVAGLAQSRPNPFASRTRIDVQVQPGEQATLAVYDVRGRLVRTLEPITGAGPGTRFWDGSDASGRRVPPGIYFYRLETATRTESHKVTLLP